MKKIIALFFIFLAPLAHAEEFHCDEECYELFSLRKTNLEWKNYQVEVEVEYFGEPVSHRRELRAILKCTEGLLVKLKEQKECDFHNIDISGDHLVYQILRYNPDDGQCDREGETVRIDLSKRCDQ